MGLPAPPAEAATAPARCGQSARERRDDLHVGEQDGADRPAPGEGRRGEREGHRDPAHVRSRASCRTNAGD